MQNIHMYIKINVLEATLRSISNAAYNSRPFIQLIPNKSKILIIIKLMIIIK